MSVIGQKFDRRIYYKMVADLTIMHVLFEIAFVAYQVPIFASDRCFEEVFTVLHYSK